MELISTNRESMGGVAYTVSYGDRQYVVRDSLGMYSWMGHSVTSKAVEKESDMLPVRTLIKLKDYIKENT